MRLFDQAGRGRWAGGRSLVPRGDTACSLCGTRHTTMFTVDALIRHGGYGASEETTVIWCECGARSTIGTSGR